MLPRLLKSRAKSMKQNRKTTIILAGFILLALIICGVIGYINDSGRISPTTAEMDNTTPTDIPATIDLVYCSSPASLCVTAFGRDNADNMLIVIRNSIPGLTEFYANIQQSNTSGRYTCQKVQFTSDVYYCLGSQIADGTMVTMDVYSKNDNKLVASGSLLVSLEATPPAPIATKLPSATAIPSEVATKLQTATTPSPIATELPSATTTPTATMTPSATQTSTGTP